MGALPILIRQVLIRQKISLHFFKSERDIVIIPDSAHMLIIILAYL